VSFSRASLLSCLSLAALFTTAVHALSFAPAVNFATGNEPRAVVVGDFNGDGRPDLAVVNQDTPSANGSVSILLATGAPGNFGAPTNFLVGNQPVSIVAADFNNDGKLDLVVCSGIGAGTYLLLGDGAGSFAVSSLGITNTFSAVAYDFNGDGKVDLAFARRALGNVTIHLGNGDGTFTAGATLPAGGTILGIAAGNLDNDGKIDLVATDSNNGVVHRYLGVGDATFTHVPGALATGPFPTTLAIGDFNGDGRGDIAVTVQNSNLIAIYLGDGAGGFAAPSTFAGGNSPQGMTAADLDRDGKLDLVSSAANDNRVRIYPGNGDGTFAAPILLVSGSQPFLSTVADLNGDGLPDIVVTNRSSDTVSIFFGTTAVVANPPTAVVATSGNAQLSVAFAPPTDAASLPVIDYTATCGAVAVTGAVSPVIVTGLLNGTTYTCTVTARNATGSSVTSAPSNSATPRSPSSVAVATSGTPSIMGTSVTMTATVTGSTPTGTVAFLGGAIPIPGCGAVALVAGIAQCSFTPGATGTVAITANYTGDAANLPGTGTLAGGQVVVSPSSVTVTTSASPVAIGASVTLRATVAGVAPTGTVNFKDGSTSIAGCGAVALVAGAAQCTTSFATAGVKSINADYGGDGTNLPNTGTLPGGQAVVAVVTTFTGPTATGNGSATVSISGGGATCGFAPSGTGPAQSAFFIPVTGHIKSPPAGTAPSGIDFPFGLLDFVLVNCTPGATVSFTVTYASPLSANAQYWKYGPTAATPAAHWYVLPATIAANVATFSITDGGLGDDDLAANGTVVDQGGPGVPPGPAAQPIPTLSEWAMALMALLLAAIGAARTRTALKP
jgi:hypothetical protein